MDLVLLKICVFDKFAKFLMNFLFFFDGAPTLGPKKNARERESEANGCAMCDFKK